MWVSLKFGFGLIPLCDSVGSYNAHTACFVVLPLCNRAAGTHVTSDERCRHRRPSAFVCFYEHAKRLKCCLQVRAVSALGWKIWMSDEENGYFFSCGADCDWTVDLWRRYGFVIWTHCSYCLCRVREDSYVIWI